MGIKISEEVISDRKEVIWECIGIMELIKRMFKIWIVVCRWGWRNEEKGMWGDDKGMRSMVGMIKGDGLFDGEG